MAWVHPPKNGPKNANDRTSGARVLLLHGLGEHSARHHNTIECLVSQGFEVVRFDFRGCGESGGEKQWLEHFGDYVEDALSVYRWSKKSLGEAPLYLMGHSLGGAIAIHAAPELGDNIAGLVLSAPAFEVGEGVSKIKIAVGRLIDRILPHTHIPAALDLSALSRDPAIAPAYEADPLCCRYNTVRQGTEILKALDQIPSKCREIRVPTLITHGEKDRIIVPKGSSRILDLLSSTDKTLEVFPGAFHEVHNDLNRDDYFRVLGTWLKSHVKAC